MTTLRHFSILLFTGVALLLSGHPVTAQENTTPAQENQNPAAASTSGEQLECEGCPQRRVGTSLLQTTGINVIYGLANLARGQVTGRITPKTWWANMQQGWVWDLDDFTVNQIGHPYQGSNYFNAGRANGLNFYESAAVTAFGSATWEYFGETNHASLNDFINTTLGGITLGEMFHRTGSADSEYAGDRQAASLERNRGDRDRSDHRPQSIRQRRRIACLRQAV